MSVLVLTVVVAVALGSAFLAKRVVDDQEKRLLHERTAEVAAFYTLAIGSAQASLGSLAAVARATHGDRAAFVANAKPLLLSTANPNGYRGLALVKTSAPSIAVVAAVGTGMTNAHLAEPAVRRALTRAAPTGYVTTGVLGSGAHQQLGSVMGPPAAPAGYSVYAEQALAPYASVDAPRTSTSAFNELTGAVYASADPDPAQLLLTSVRDLPLKGRNVGRETVAVGPDKWLIEIKPRTSLVGTFATQMPWLLLVLGLALAVVLTTVVEALGRRRVYAEEIVAERTSELRESLSDLEHAQEQLVLSERLAAIGQVASTVGHELRNPLGVMANAIYLLRLRTDDPLAGRQLDLLEREVHSAARISSDLLDFARTRPPEWSTVDLRELIAEALAMIPCPEGVTVHRREPDDIGNLRADRDQLRQVLLNLLGNAFEAVGDSGSITVSVQRLDGAVRLEVADTGAGMDAVTSAHLFEPFFTTKSRGTGLGLAVCQRLVEAHGGTIVVTSTPGTGARFAVTLPRVPAERSRLDPLPVTSSAGATP